MEYSLTIFESIFDNKTHRSLRLESWDAFKNLLFGLSTKPGYKPQKGEYRRGSPLISPAAYKEGTTRRNDNVTHWGGWAALDVDDYTCSFEEALSQFSSVRHIYYSSASSTEKKPKFRVIIPCTAIIPVDKIKHFWYALNKEYNELGDPQTKDLSRMYYVPAQYPGSYQFIHSHEEGEFLDPNTLMSKHHYVSPKSLSFRDSLSTELREKLLQYRKENLTNKDYKWSSYQDCPFINKSLIGEYRAISETGWYAKMYTILCSIASNAIRRGYPITENELTTLAKEIDADTGGWYANRPFQLEASRAITWALENH